MARRGFRRGLGRPVPLRPARGDLRVLDAEAALILDIPEEELDRHRNGGPEYLVPPEVADRYPTVAALGVEVKRKRRILPAAAALLLLTAAIAGIAIAAGGDDDSPPQPNRPAQQARPGAPPERPQARPEPDRPPSRAVGTATAGRLVNGMPLAAEGANHFTWDLTKGRGPSPRFRRFATDRTLARIERVLAGFRRANPGAPRVGVADLSLEKGGPFGLEYGGSGHLSHQNGLDVDLLYPLKSGREAEATDVNQVDGELSQDLIDRFVRAGAVEIFVSPSIGVEPASDVVQFRAKHDEHMHVRFPN